VALVGLGSGSARADWQVGLSPSSSSVAAGGSVDVTVQVTTDANGGQLAGFTAAVYLVNAPSGLQISNAVTPTSGYVFDGNSFGYVANPLDASGNPLSGFPSAGVALSDLANNPAYVTLAANTTYNLGTLTLSAANGTTPGTYGVRFDTTVTEFDSSTGGTYAYSAKNGSVTVGSSLPVPTPAPSTLVLLAIGGAVVAAVRLRRASAGCAAVAA
jgi:hypothetical protein